MSEYLLKAEGLTSEKITAYRNAHAEANEIVCLIPRDDQPSIALLGAHGFRYTGVRMVDGNLTAVFKWFKDLAGRYEDMASFFDRRASDYDQHMRVMGYYEISLQEIASNIPVTEEEITILDLGCGTGAELEFVFQRAPQARITCVDLSEGMLRKLTETYSDRSGQIRVACASYLDMDFGVGQYDYVIACNTLHHILGEKKSILYAGIRRSLKKNGLLLISDYTVSEEDEKRRRKAYLDLVSSGTINGEAVYHIDVPLSDKSERELLEAAGFNVVRVTPFGEDGVVFIAEL